MTCCIKQNRNSQQKQKVPDVCCRFLFPILKDQLHQIVFSSANDVVNNPLLFLFGDVILHSNEIKSDISCYIICK